MYCVLTVRKHVTTNTLIAFLVENLLGNVFVRDDLIICVILRSQTRFF